MKKTKQVKNWNELVEFIETLNPKQDTIVLTGWINEVFGETTYIKKLLFSTKPVEILKEVENDDGSKQKSKRKTTTATRKGRSTK